MNPEETDNKEKCNPLEIDLLVAVDLRTSLIVEDKVASSSDKLLWPKMMIPVVKIVQ